MSNEVKKTPAQNDRLSHLWDLLLSDPVAPHPLARGKTTPRARLEMSRPVAPSFAPDLERPSLLSQPESEPEVFVGALSYGALEENATPETVLSEEEPMEPFVLSNYEPDSLTVLTGATEPESHIWRDSPGGWLHRLVEPHDPQDPPLSVEEANPETEAPSDVSIEVAHAESLSFSSPFRWDPRPAWVNPPAQSKPSSPQTVAPERFVYKPKIPMRPFHRQRFYKRLFFYLRNWLSRSFRKTA